MDNYTTPFNRRHQVEERYERAESVDDDDDEWEDDGTRCSCMYITNILIVLAYDVWAHSQQQNDSRVARYHPGETLQPILTGETLHIEPSPPHRAPPHMQHISSHDDHSDYIPPSRTSSDESDEDDGDENPFQSNSNTYAYATGRYPTSFPRSRSPTPAVDDEDYHVDGDTSIHYTGPSSTGDTETVTSEVSGPMHYPQQYTQYNPIGQKSKCQDPRLH